MFNLAAPLIGISNSFAGIFGGNNYSSLDQLLHVHMKMLDSISSKLDNVQKGILFVLANQERYEIEIKAVPVKTVEELYKKDIEGLFIIVREKIEAYISEKENNTLTAQKSKLIFDEILRELQIARGRIMLIDSYLILPIIATCLHFEIFCMVLANQPKTYIKVILKSYKNWINKVIGSEFIDGEEVKSKLKNDYDNQFKEQNHLLQTLEIPPFVFTKSKEEKPDTYQAMIYVDKDGKEIDGELVTRHTTSYTIYLKKFSFNLVNIWNDDLKKEISLLIKNGLIAENQVCLGVALNYVEEATHFFQEHKRKNIRPTIVNATFQVPESETELRNCINRTDETADNNKPIISENIKEEISKINEEGYKLIMYASIMNTGIEALKVIEKLLANPQNLTKDSILEFAWKNENIIRINKERIKIWVNYIQNKIDLVEDAKRKAQILEIKDRMEHLKDGSDSILEEYSRLEKELAEAMPDNLLAGIINLLEPLGKELEIGVQNIIREHERFIDDLGKNVEKAVQDVGKELERGVHNVGDAVEAAANFCDNQFKSYGQILDDAQKRVLEGKIVDALWHLSTDHFKHTEENAAIAFMESSLLTSIASSVVSIYGAPYGGAAFAAWLTYKRTGDLGLVLKTAAITYLTQESLKGAKSIGLDKTTGIHSSSVTDIAKRTLVTSAIGAAAIAASGGSEKDIIDGFLKGTAMIVANEVYKSQMDSYISDEIATEDPIDKFGDDALKAKYGILLDNDGQPIYQRIELEDGTVKWVTQIDPAKIPLNITQVGIADDKGSFGIAGENSFLLKKLALIPGVNAMARFHDKWCAIINSDEMLGATPVTIIPAVALTIAGRNQMLIDNILEELNKGE